MLPLPLLALWTLLLFQQVSTFVISGVTAQW